MHAGILLVCSIILTSFVRELEGIDFLHGKLMNNPKLLLEKQNILRECFCLPVNNGGKRVSEVISPEGKHKGRLVVYLYKNPNNQLTVYVPNREKQLAIPDLTLDEGEVLEKITNTKMKDLFETSSSIVVPNPGKHLTDHGYIKFNLNKHLNELININENQNLENPNVPQIVKQQEINNENPSSVLNFENQDPMNTIEDNIHINPDELLQIPGGSLEIPGGSLQIPEGSLQIPDESQQIPKELEIIVTNPHRLPQHTIESEQSLVEIEQPSKNPNILVGPESGNVLPPDVSGSVEYRPPEGTFHLIETNTNIAPSLSHNEKPNYNIFSPIKPQQLPEIQIQEPQPSTQTNNAEILPGTADQTQQILPGTISDSSIGLSIETKPNKKVVVKPSPDKGKLVIIEDQPNSATVVPNENVHVSMESNVQDSSLQDLSYNLLPMKQFMLNFPNEQPDNATPFPNGNRPLKHTLSDKMTFDQWLVQQIRLLQLHKPFMYYSIDIDALKLVILKALQNNGIRVSGTGVLKDSNGKTIQMSHLQLQPILLGDPIEYEKLLALNKCTLPYNLPYLKAMFVTLSYPPRILGIIYLGNSYHKCSHGLCPQKTTCHSNQCKQSGVSHTQKVIVHSTKSNPDLSQIVEIPSSEGNNPKLNKKLLGTISRRLNDLEHSDDNSLQRLIPDSALEPLPEVSKSRANNEGVSDENISLVDLFPFDDNKVEDAGDYDDLGIRIIGGQPATASGTPITSKGRSGYDD